jgi:hypothetical protein
VALRPVSILSCPSSNHLSINNDSHKSLRVLRRLLLWAKGTRRFATTSLRVAGLMLMTNGDHLRVT